MGIFKISDQIINPEVYPYGYRLAKIKDPPIIRLEHMGMPDVPQIITSLLGGLPVEAQVGLDGFALPETSVTTLIAEIP